jgi:hypothetical protein
MTDASGIPFTADQEFQAGFTCNAVHATPTTPLPFICPASEFGSTLTPVPVPGTQNDDQNPARIARILEYLRLFTVGNTDAMIDDFQIHVTIASIEAYAQILLGRRVLHRVIDQV